MSYLDLTRRAAAGDWSSFVQGYWSPLYPALIAMVSAVTGRDAVSLVATAHAINGVVTIGAVILLWWWGRQVPGQFYTRALIATLLLVSTGLPRIEAVTPDVLLLALMACTGYELLLRQGKRSVLLGLLLGAAFLAKTSTWPWLAVAIPLRLWGARDAAERRGVLVSSGVCVLVMLFWIIPLSLKTGHPTLGSAGRLNYEWYILASDGRTPDTHAGGHTAYSSIAVDSTHRVGWAEFPAADRWTYAPWSDPTAWQSGVLTQNSSAPTTWELVSYWGRQTARSFGLWLLPVILAVLLPFYLLNRPAQFTRYLLGEGRPVLAVALLGLAGVGQFILVHAEPRLLAPFGLLLALALLHGLSAKGSEPPRFPMAVRQGASLLGLLCTAGFAVPRLREGFAANARIGGVLSSMAATKASLAGAGLSQDRIVILGSAMAVTPGAFLSGAHVVAQIPPRSLEVAGSLPPPQQVALLTRLFGGKAQIAWLTSADGGVRIVRDTGEVALGEWGPDR